MAYATVAELEEYTGVDTIDDAERKLDRASDLLDEVLVGVFYDVDASEDPTDATVIAAFRNAVCAQVEWWEETGDELGGLEQFSSVGIGSVSLVRANSATKGTPPGRLCARALAYLRVAGLTPVAVAIGHPSVADRFFGSESGV